MKLNAKKWVCLIAACVLIVAGVFAVRKVTKPGDALYATLKITAMREGAHGIEPDTSFAVTLDRSINEETLRAMLRLEPELEYTLTGGGRKWELTPVTPLERSAVYTIRAVNTDGTVMRSFAFQTDSALLVNSSYPRPGSSWVECGTGIEITFNALDVDASQHLGILPETKGSFRVTGNTVAFVPQEPLLENNVYRITVKQGLTAPNGMVLEEDYSFSFETEGGDDGKNGVSLSGLYAETFLPGDPVVVGLEAYRPESETVDVTVYRFADTQAYARALTERSMFYTAYFGPKKEYQVDTAPLEVVYTGTQAMERSAEDWSGQRRIKLADGLATGCYVVTVTTQAEHAQSIQKLVQVCDTAVYTQSVSGETLVWLNNAATGEPLTGARVQLQDKASAEQRAGVTDANGLLTLQTDKIEGAWMSIADGGRLAYFGEILVTAATDTPLRERFYSALYTDRTLYQPTDTIRLWGVLRARNGAVQPKAVDVVLENMEELHRSRVTLNADGTFTAELPITGLEQNSYSLRVTEPGGSEEYDSAYLRVERFAKPAMTIAVEHKKPWYFADEAIDFSVSAAFYDGTPAAGLNLRMLGDELTGRPEGTVRTGENAVGENTKWEQTLTEAERQARSDGAQITLDEFGRASLASGVTQDYFWSGWSPSSAWYEFSPSGAENGYTKTTGTVTVLPSRYAIDAVRTENDSILVQAAQFNTAVVGAEFDYTKSMFERYAGAPAELTVTVELMETVRHETQTGTYYDEVEKRNMPQYSYQFEEVLLETRKLTTTGGRAEWVLNGAWPNEDSERNIWARIRFESGMGYQIEERVARKYTRAERGNAEYALRTSASRDVTPRFALDEQIPLRLYYGKELAENKSRMLYTVAQSSALTTDITTENSVNLTFAEQYVPGISVYGAYFDGRHIHMLEQSDLRYNYSERTLAVTVEPEHESYAPGEQASVTVTLRDAAGKPVAGSACIGVVDESIFTLAPQDIDIAAQLYDRWITTTAARSGTYMNYDGAVNPGTAGGMGGGGDANVLRADFMDTALFQTVEIPESGSAQVKLSLPENITKWRLTAVAVAPNGAGGDAVGATVATLPFYARAIVTDTYTEGDDVTAAVMSVGTELKAGEPVEYNVRVLDEQGKAVYERTWNEQSGKQTYENFGKLPQGSYRLMAQASAAQLTDGVELPFMVAPTGATMRVTERMELAQIATIKPQRWPIVVSVFDKTMETYMNGLNVLSGRTGSRTEVLAAAYRARVAQNELLPKEERQEIAKDGLTAVQDYESGVKPLPNAEPDAALTAKLLMTAPQLVNKEFARIYLQNVQKDASATRDSRIMAYVGLAVLREPVLLDIRAMVQTEELTTAQKLYLGAALASLGDFEGAQSVYAQYVQAVQKGENGELYLSGSNRNEELANTGAALMLCSIAGHEDAEGLMKYLCTYAKRPRAQDETVLVELDMLAYIHYYRFQNDAQASFRYTREGKPQVIKLGARGAAAVTWTAETFAEADITAVSGELAADVTYQAQAKLDTAAPYVTAEKTITPLSGTLGTTKLARVDIRLTFADDAPEGLYNVYDVIPSGMRYYEHGTGQNVARGDYTGWWQRVINEGQQMQGSIWLRRGDGPVPLETERENPGAITEGAVAASSEVLSEAETAIEASMEAAENPVTDASALEAESVENPVIDDTADTGTPEEPQDDDYTVTYYVICSLPGSYVLESAYVTDENGVPVASTPRGTLEVQK